MKTTTAFALASIVKWLSVSIAISVGLYYTHDIRCLWFILIPGIFGLKMTHLKENDEGET